MKRDMDIVRKIAIQTADMEHGQLLASLEDVDAAIFGFHVILMQEAGLVTASIQEYASGEPPKAFVRRLTWQGCEFVDAVRSDTIWSKAKAMVIRPTAAFTFELLKAWLAEELRKRLLPGGGNP